jgi:hypothetical protein
LYWSISPADPITPNVSVSGGSCGGADEDGADDGAEPPRLLADELAVEDPDASQAARRPVARRAATRRVARCRLHPELSRTAETLTARDNEECAGPGAPHGAWPLAAADVGTRGCRGPAHSRTVYRVNEDVRALSDANGST